MKKEEAYLDYLLSAENENVKAFEGQNHSFRIKRVLAEKAENMSVLSTKTNIGPPAQLPGMPSVVQNFEKKQLFERDGVKLMSNTYLFRF